MDSTTQTSIQAEQIQQITELIDRSAGEEARRLAEHQLDEDSPARVVLDQVGSRWGGLVLTILDHGAMRFTEIERHIPGISQRMLTVTLRSLERDGLVTRTVYAEVPPRVEYEVTDLGRSLTFATAPLLLWGSDHYDQVMEARHHFDSHE